MKRVISFVVCLCMLVSMLPVSAFAAEATEAVPETTAVTEAVAAEETEAPEEEPTEEAAGEVTEEATEAAAEEAVEETVSEVTEAAAEAYGDESEPEEETAEVTTVTGTVDMELESDDVLFAVYANSLFSGEELTLYGTTAGDRLTGDQKLAYDALAALISQVAAGELDTGILTVGHNIGKVSIDGEVVTCVPMEEVAFTGTSFSKADLTAVIGALLRDMPYSLYWFDKTIGHGVQSIVTGSGKLFLTFSLPVSADYSVTGAEDTYDVDTGKTGAATAAAENALDIVNEFSGGTDLEILTAYKDRICELTSYNHAAADDESTPYGDPWQLIHVFDGDSSTMVVCEGYAKAFQHLCDQSDFAGDVVCESVSGSIPEGLHMWNIVSIGGSSYLVDLTSCDVGYDLFLAGGPANSDGSYTLDGVTYTYNEDTLAQWDDDLLALAEHYYGAESGEPEEETALDRFLAALETADGDVTIWDNIVLEEDLTISIPGTLFFADYASLEVPQGVTLTLNCPTAFNGAHLQVNGTLISNVDLSFSDANSSGSFTVDGCFENYGTCWINDGSEMNINYTSDDLPGEVTSYGTFHIGFGRGGSVDINNGGCLIVYGYLNNLGTIDIDEKSAVEINGVYEFEDGTGTNGFFQAGGTTNVHGFLGIAGGLTLGSDEGDSASITIKETGQMWVTEDVMWCDILATGCLLNYGTLTNEGDINLQGTYENYGSLIGTPPMDAADRLIVALTGSGDVVIEESITLENDFTITAKSVTIQNGAVLTLNGDVEMAEDTDLYVDGENSTLLINGTFLADYKCEAFFINGGRLTVTDTVKEWRGDLQIGSEDSCGYVLVKGSGTMNKSCGGWQMYPGSDLTVHKGGTLILDYDGEMAGSLNLGCEATVKGDLIIRGSLWVYGNDRDWDGVLTVGETGRIVFEGGHLNIDVGASLFVNGTVQRNDPEYTHSSLTNQGTACLPGGGELYDLNNSGTMTARDLTVCGGVYNDGELILNGSSSFTGYNTNHGNLRVTADESGSAALDVFADLYNAGTIQVDEDCVLTVHEDATLTNSGEQGWQTDEGCSHGDLYINGTMNVNGTLENSGYICVGETVEEPDPYSGSQLLRICAAGRLYNRADGALDIMNNGTLEMNGTAENHGVGNGIANEGLIWLDGQLDSYGYMINNHHIQINYFASNDALTGGLTIHADALLDNNGYIALMNGGSLTVDGQLLSLWKDEDNHGNLDLNGNVQINGKLTAIGDLNLPGQAENSTGGIQSCTITVGKNGTLSCDSMYIHKNGTVVNNGTIEYMDVFAVNENGSFTGNEPVSKAFEKLLDALYKAAEQNTGVSYEGTVIVPQGNYSFPALAEGCELTLVGGQLIVPAGATLTLNCPVSLYGTLLVVEEGASLTNFAQLTLGARNGDRSQHSTAIFDGQIHNLGQIWMTSCSEMTVNGHMSSLDAMHIGFDGGAKLTVNGALDNFGYLNLVDEGDSAITVGAGGALNIGIARDENGEPTATGFLQAGGHVHVYGTLNLDGLCVMGEEAFAGADAHPEHLTVYEGGFVNFTAPQEPEPVIITRQPESVTVAKGELAEVTFEAAGDELTYKWYYRNAGASKFTLTTTFTGPSYKTEMTAARDGREVYCVITDKYGNEVTTDTVTLNMTKFKVAIVRQPVDAEAANGKTARVTVEATGDGLTYKWYYKNPGASKFTLTTSFTGPTYSLSMSASRSGRQVYCVITDEYGNKVKTDTVTLTMKSSIVILQQPVSVSAANGKTARVTVVAEGEGLTYAWYFKNPGSSKFSKTSSFTGPTYSVAMNADRSGRQVYCVITSTDGTTLQTDTATLTLDATPLRILTQPTDVEVANGQTAAVTVKAQGDGLTYKWYYKNPDAAKFSLTTSFTGPTYSVAMSASRSGRQVYCIITDAYGNKVQSDTVTLRLAVTTPLVILQQPVSVSVASGKVAKVTVTAEGEGLTYEWYYANAGSTKFTKTTSFTGNSYSISMNADRAGRRVYCVITDVSGASVQTNTVTLSMTVPQLTITRQPSDVTVASGKTAKVTVEATGEGLTYEWYYAGSGSDKFTKTTSFKSNTYSVTMTEARNGRRVYCVITDAAGNSVTSNIVTLRMVSTQLAITKQPSDVTVASGKTAKVTVEATGEGLTYQWYYKNAGSSKFALTSAFDGPTYSVTMNSDRDGRQVYCIITDANGNKVQSNTVTLNMA